MPLTREFKVTVKARAQRDPAFRIALLRESAEAFLAGDVEAGKSLLRDYINATIGFEALAKATETSPKSLMRMLSAGGNPQSKSLFAVTQHLQAQEGLRFEVHAVKSPTRQAAVPRRVKTLAAKAPLGGGKKLAALEDERDARPIAKRRRSGRKATPIEEVVKKRRAKP